MKAPQAFLFAALLACAALAQPAAAQQYPSKPVRVIAAYPTGSGPDSVLRLVADKLSRAWGQQIIVDNRPAGNGFIAGEAAKRAAPDGYTLLMMDNAHLTVHPHLYKQMPYDPAKDFDPVATLFETYFFVVVPANSPWKNMTDLIASAKAKPERITYGSWFIGSSAHLGAAQLEGATGIRMTHIPFQGVTLLYPAVGNNDVDWAFGSVASSGATFRAGKIKYLAVAAPKRIAGFTDIPTVAEAGGPADFEVRAWVTLLAPHGTPKDVIARINADVAKALAEPDVRERLAGMGFDPFAATPAEIVKMRDSDSRKHAEIIKRSNISLD